MRLIVDHSALRTALQLCATCVTKRQVIPILAHVLLHAAGDELRLGATDLETTVITSLDAAVREDGACTVELSVLMELTKNATDKLALHAHDGKLDIVTGDSSYQLLTLPPQDFPRLPEMLDADSVTMSASTLLPMIRTCSYPMTSEETRAQLNGELFQFSKGTLTVVAADWHRMSFCEASVRAGRQCDIFAPATLIEASAKLSASPDGFDVVLSWNDSHVSLMLGRDSLIGRRPDVNFPQWRNAIPKDLPVTIVTDAHRFLSAVRAVAPFSQKKAMRLSLSNGELALSCEHEERGTARVKIAVGYSGKEMEFGYESRSLRDALETIPTTRIVISIGDDGDLTIQPHESQAPYSALHVIKPMRLRAA